jgi:hypothetical protein
MDIENDESIRVNIRTGTSTRRPQPLPISRGPNPFLYNTLFNLLSVREDSLARILDTSLTDTGLRKNPSIYLDIPVRSFKQSDWGHKCTVCQSDYKEGEELTTLQKCKHTFHYNCLQEWGKYKQECPHCRDSIGVIPNLENL